jgi:hypothetical protein
MSNNTLSIFNPFSLQSGPKGPLQQRMQEIAWYAESRFRRILLEISKANLLKQQWMQKLLHFGRRVGRSRCQSHIRVETGQKPQAHPQCGVVRNGGWTPSVQRQNLRPQGPGPPTTHSQTTPRLTYHRSPRKVENPRTGLAKLLVAPDVPLHRTLHEDL